MFQINNIKKQGQLCSYVCPAGDEPMLTNHELYHTHVIFVQVSQTHTHTHTENLSCFITSFVTENNVNIRCQVMKNHILSIIIIIIIGHLWRLMRLLINTTHTAGISAIN